MRILVTGATGFLGQALCRRLRADGHQVHGLGSAECDLTQQGALEAHGQVLFEQIFHLAAWTQAGDFCLRHPGEQWVINQQINTNVLTWWQDRQAQAKMICIGTSCAYAPDADLRESEYLNGLPIDSLLTYAYTKRMLLVGLQALARQYGMRYLYLVPSTLYGPDYHTDGRQLHFIFDLIRKILRAKQSGEPVVLWGDGLQRRELVLREDFINIMLRLNARCDNELINIGAGEEFSIRHFAGRICAAVGYDEQLIQYDTTKYVGATSKCLDVTRLRELLPDLSMTPLETGLRETIDWFARHAMNN